MNIGILGNKIGMTHIFDKKGVVVPVTIIKAGPCVVTQIKEKKNNGYNAIQLGYLPLFSKSKRLTKPVLLHFLKKKLIPCRYLKEYKVNETTNFFIGQMININLFKINELVNVSGKTIGKGNIGNIKKNSFKRGPMTHGSKHHRLQGSLGAGTSPGRVFPGKKMPGRLGGNLQTLKNLRVIDLNFTENLLIIKGSIPGKSGNLINIKKI